MEGAWQGREAIAPRPRKSGDFLFPSARREAKSSQAVRHEEETRLQQRLKGHLKEFCREAASTEIKARPPKSDEEICKELSSTEALEMRSFRGSDLWLSHITASLDGTQILAPRWKEYEYTKYTVEGDVPLASESLDIFLDTLASVDPMDLMEQEGRASRGSQRQGPWEQGEAEMAATSPNAQERPRASATKVDAFLLEEVPASKSSKDQESLFKMEVDLLVPANVQEQVASAIETEDIFEKHAGGDGALSKQELEMLQGENAHLRQLDFDKLDLDGDGVVSKEELATALDWDTMEEVKGEDLLRRYDGGDGTLSRAELEQMKGENAHLRQLDFDKLDLDGDGVVSKEELATALDWDSMGEVKDKVSAQGKRASDGNAKAKAKVASALDVHQKSREAFDVRSAASQRKEKRRAKRKSIQDLAETSGIVQNGDVARVARKSGHSKDEGLQSKTATEQAVSTTIANNFADQEARQRGTATSAEDQQQRTAGDVEHFLESEGHGGVPGEESEVGQETVAQQKHNQQDEEASQEKAAHPGQEMRQKRVGQEDEARQEKQEDQKQQEQQEQDITGEHVAEQGPEKQETKEQEPRQERAAQQASAKQEPQDHQLRQEQKQKPQEPEPAQEHVAQQGPEKQEPQELQPREEHVTQQQPEKQEPKEHELRQQTVAKQGPEKQEQGVCEEHGGHRMQSMEEERVSQEYQASQEKEQPKQEASHEDVAQQEQDKQHQEHTTQGQEAHVEEVGQKHMAQKMQEKHEGQEQIENAPESVGIRRSAGSAGMVVARQIVNQSGVQRPPEEGLLANPRDQGEDEMPKEHAYAGLAEAAAPSVRTSMKSNESIVQESHPTADQVSEDRQRLQDLREAGVLESAGESEGTITPKEDALEPALQQEDQGRDSYVSSAGLDFETF